MCVVSCQIIPELKHILYREGSGIGGSDGYKMVALMYIALEQYVGAIKYFGFCRSASIKFVCVIWKAPKLFYVAGNFPPPPSPLLLYHGGHNGSALNSS